MSIKMESVTELTGITSRLINTYVMRNLFPQPTFLAKINKKLNFFFFQLPGIDRKQLIKIKIN